MKKNLDYKSPGAVNAVKSGIQSAAQRRVGADKPTPPGLASKPGGMPPGLLSKMKAKQ